MGSILPSYKSPVIASIGSLLLDVFDKPKGVNATSKPIPPGVPCPPAPSSSSTSDEQASFAHYVSQVSTEGAGASTPQKSFGANEESEETYEVLGGGALYAMVGSRIWLGPSQVRTLVDRRSTNGEAEEGPELSEEFESILRRYGRISIVSEGKGKAVARADNDDDNDDEEEAEVGMWVFNEGPEKRLAKSRIRYEGDTRLYQRLHPPPHRTFSDLLSSPLRNAEYLHISPPFSSVDLHSLLEEISSVNSTKAEKERWFPKILFEPTPPSCHAKQRPWLEKVFSGIEVFSPNHEELLSLYAGHPVLTSLQAESGADYVGTLRTRVEALITHILDIGIGRNGDGAVVIRAGRTGSVVGTRKGGIRWFPAFYSREQEGMVKDVTGAGNAYLGGFAAGLYLTGGDAYKAAAYGTISSAFTVEQVGLPILSTNEHGEEQWNGKDPVERLREFEARLGAL